MAVDLPRPLHDVFQIYSVAHGLGKVASHVSLVAAGRSPGVQSALEQLNRDLTEAMAQVSMLADSLLFAVLADLHVEEPGEGCRRWSPFWYRALGRAIELRVGAHERLNTLLARDYDSLLESLSFVARELQTSSGPASLVASAGAVATEAVWLHGASALHIAHVPFLESWHWFLAAVHGGMRWPKHSETAQVFSTVLELKPALRQAARSFSGVAQAMAR